MNTYSEPAGAAANTYGLEMARQTTGECRFPVMDGLNEEVASLTRHIEQSNAILADIAERLTGPVPEMDSTAPVFDNSLSGRVRELEGVVCRYESLLTRF